MLEFFKYNEILSTFYQMLDHSSLLWFYLKVVFYADTVNS